MRIGIYNNETAESQRVTKVLKTEMKRAGDRKSTRLNSSHP